MRNFGQWHRREYSWLKIIRDKNIYISMLACFLAGIASFGVVMYQNGGIFTVTADFNTQQIPFLTSLNGHFKNFAGTWCWNVDLGTQLIGGYSFYNLGSPFMWITFLFPKSSIPYLMGWMYILKYMVAGVASYLYLQRFAKQRQYAVLGALLYAFSGFQSTNLLFFHFHDVVALFPFMLIGLEELINKRKKTLFIFAICINCMTNYFFFISEVIFLILYYILRFWRKDIKLFLKDGLLCLFCGIVGTGMAAILFLPSILYIIGNSRTESFFGLRTLFYYGGHILLAAKGFLFPGEAMGNQSCIVPEYWYSASCYLPMTGGALVFAYMLKKKKDWLTKLLLFLWVVSCSPAMNSAFYMFTEPYKRWWFMFALMMAAATVMVLDDKESYPVKTGICINAVLLCLFCAGLFFLDSVSWTDGKVILRNDIFLYNCGIALAGLSATWFLCAGKRPVKRRAFGSLLVCAAIFCSATTSFALSLYRQNAETGKEYMARYRLGLQLKEYDSQYRYNLSDNVLTLTGGAIGVGSFNSTISNSVNDFDMLFDFERQNRSMDPNSVPGLKELLAARYQIVRELPQGRTAADVLNAENGTFYVVEEPACPIGFVQSTYITRSEERRVGKECL